MPFAAAACHLALERSRHSVDDGSSGEQGGGGCAALVSSDVAYQDFERRHDHSDRVFF